MKRVIIFFIFLGLHLNEYGQVESKERASIFTVADEMPRFPGCEQSEYDIKEKESCAQKLMLDDIYKNLKYPERAKKIKAEGVVVVQFVVNEFGDIENPQLARSIGFGCDEEALRVVESMNEMKESWIPGKQRGEIVSVLYTLPIRFKLAK